VKKMSKIGDDAPPTPRPPAAPPGPKAGEGETPPAPGEKQPPAPPAVPDAAQKAREGFAWLQEQEKKLKSDPGALKSAYEQFLVDNPDPSLPEYEKAAARIGELQKSLDDLFKDVAKKDPEQIEGLDAKPKALYRLTADLNTKDPELRRKAARLLGLTRSGAASYALVKVLRDDDEEVAKLAAESLVTIGGWRTGEVLTKEYRDRSHESQVVALDVLQRIAQKGPIDAQSISHWIGRFVLSPDGEVANQALVFLENLGADGGPGLVEAMETRRADKKLAVMEAIGKVKYHRGAERVAAHLLRGDGPAVEIPRQKAQNVLQQLGVPAIPYLYRAFADGRTHTWTNFTLKQMTGEYFKDVASLKRWYEMHKNDRR
jgi:hypothetical protein